MAVLFTICVSDSVRYKRVECLLPHYILVVQIPHSRPYVYLGKDT